jgi:hypothetical protein
MGFGIRATLERLLAFEIGVIRRHDDEAISANQNTFKLAVGDQLACLALVYVGNFGRAKRLQKKGNRPTIPDFSHLLLLLDAYAGVRRCVSSLRLTGRGQETQLPAMQTADRQC